MKCTKCGCEITAPIPPMRDGYFFCTAMCENAFFASTDQWLALAKEKKDYESNLPQQDVP